MSLRYTHWTDTRRTPKTDARLGACLAFVAGAANAGGFLAVGQYTSHMSGMVSGIADHLSARNLELALACVVAVCSFLAGAITTSILVNYARRKRLHSQYSIPMLLEAALLLLFGLIGAQIARQVTFLQPPTVVLLCYMMGLQNALITKISNAVIRTTHVTGMVTDIGIELGKLFYINSPRATHRGQGRVVANRAKLILHSKLLLAFLVGAMTGAFGFQSWGYSMTLPLSFFLLVLALPPLWNDLRVRWRVRRYHPAEELHEHAEPEHTGQVAPDAAPPPTTARAPQD
ncbi:YoaK family protein [Kerstersia similis]|uniref:YoaK family protein n=1 Tax=Kerstersia similis TaxID=206505 RepID=UPI0039EF626D